VTDDEGAVPAELRALDEALALASTDHPGGSTADGRGD
jgi:hypothetical protein